jgi:hypothetical protein
MKRFNYYRGKLSITKAQFESVVPENWMGELDEYGCYYYGEYKAILVD